MFHTPAEATDTAEPAGRVCAACRAPCAEVCFNDAVVHAGEAVLIDAGRCAGCGACAGACRHGRIALVDGFARYCFD
jgi:Fe-S-cluster-containing hydrogenase component 2